MPGRFGARGRRREVAILVAVLALASLARGAHDPATAAPTADAPATERPAVVRYAHGRLTVDVSEMPLAQFLAALEHATGARIDARIQHWEPVTARIDDVPLSAALERLLGSRSFLLTYGRRGMPRRLTIFARALPSAVTANPPRPAPASELATAVATQPPVTLPADLLALFPGGQPTLLRLMTRARGLTDARLRQSALQTIAQTLTTAPRLRAALQRTPPEEISRLTAVWMGPLADDLLARMAAGSDPLVRGRVALARQRLATLPAGGR